MSIVPRIVQSERALFWRRVALVFLLGWPVYFVGGNLAIANGSPFLHAHSIAFFIGCLLYFLGGIPVGLFFWWPVIRHTHVHVVVPLRWY